jgi:succinate dehydrogenase / fumarate reductase iron-sulfur subunit
MNKIKISFLRKKDKDSEAYTQSFDYEGDCRISVVEMIEYINHHPPEPAGTGGPFRPISYESSCEQGLCGACAMVVNGKPVLACETFCDEAADRDGRIKVEPLSKFPVVCDLTVDRNEIFETMKKMGLWVEGQAAVSPSTLQLQYIAAQCLLCGCCLEACPNYAAGDFFAGAAGAVSAMNMLKLNGGSRHKDEIKKQYGERVFKTCTKSRACELVCPAKIPVLTLMSEANRLSVWRLWQFFCGK